MAHEEATGKTTDELAERAWELAGSIRTAIFATWSGQRQHLTPMSATVEREVGALYFLTTVDAAKVAHIQSDPNVVVAFVDESANKYVTFSGRANVSNDREKIRELWTVFASAWWESADDPSIRLITVVPGEAELWDSPGKLIASVLMLTAAISGTQPAVGDHATVRIR